VNTLKDYLRSNEPKEGAPQQKIGISMTDDQVSTEPTPDTSISIDTQTLDERQIEDGPSKHKDEVQEPSLEQVYTIRESRECNHLGRSTNP
jgi:hypothetical protein